ncbi:NAD synthetase, NH3-dependent [Aliarcobacter faecis]|uniref:NAD+ synthase n=1 Tax=Aliarcobacter faecis TaxID=1564138 RepID=UPI000479292B|nr:NAD+ synthase [Aliarcobacter faecis]QKF73402.1 NAD synthetase, NH3-dependent [Aliarcobacter faecis]
MNNWQNIKQKLINFLEEEVSKTGHKSVVLGLSGGLDSAIVAVLCKEVFKENLLCVLLPSQFSSKSSVDDALKLCEKFDIKYEIVSIEPMLKAYISNMQNDSLRIGNFSARLRMNVLYDISAREKSLVIGTSNKSELLLGYGTIFGDLACAINPIGNIYKSDLFEFAKFLGVAEAIINKAPSADLYEGQSDEADLGFNYAQIDEFLRAFVDKKSSRDELLNLGFDEDMIEKIIKRVKINSFKRELPKIAQI